MSFALGPIENKQYLNRSIKPIDGTLADNATRDPRKQ